VIRNSPVLAVENTRSYGIWVIIAMAFAQVRGLLNPAARRTHDPLRCPVVPTARGFARHAAAAINGTTGAHVDWTDSRGLDEWERTALELSEDRSKLG